MMNNELVQALFALAASVLVVGCIILLVLQVDNWIPLALVIAAIAALFTLAAWRIRRGR